MIGNFILRSSKIDSMAKSAALALSVSNIVSTSKQSTPPSINASVCSLYALTRSPKVTAL